MFGFTKTEMEVRKRTKTKETLERQTAYKIDLPIWLVGFMRWFGIHL